MSNSGGTLTLPSPTHAHHHHVDVQAGLRTLRRSLSRSPSKFSLARTASQSSSDAGSAPTSPSCRRVQSQLFAHNTSTTPNAPHPNGVYAQSPLATPFRPSTKFALRSAKASKSPSTASKLSRNRTSPKSPPARRALGMALNSVNSTPVSTTPPGAPHSPGQENQSPYRLRNSPASRSNSSTSLDKLSNRHSMHLDMSGSTQLTRSRFSDATHSPGHNATASPLKRSDATMNLDQSFTGTPNPKRRSFGLHQASDLSLLAQGTPSPDAQEDSNHEYSWGSPSGFAEPPEVLPSPTPAAMPRRAGSLRKSTLQQRHGGDRPAWGRRSIMQQPFPIANDAGSPFARSHPRKSLDQSMPPPSRDSPFNATGPLPNPSAHVLGQQTHQPHPLSRTMTTSSSNSSIGDDSPTHFPISLAEKPRAPMNWSKSLPLGAIRPMAEGHATGSVSTPDYKHAKPFEGAFHSTGLVSKVNRYPEFGPPAGRGGGSVMPDTPCKKVNGFATYPPPPTSGRTRLGKHRSPFGGSRPSTPFNPMPGRSQNTFGDHARPNLFTSFGQNHGRRGSVLSVYSDDGRSPLENSGDLSNVMDGDVPPTPTKHQLLNQSSSNLSQVSNESPTTNRHLPAPISAVKFGEVRQPENGASCKLHSSREPCDQELETIGIAPLTSAPDSQLRPDVQGSHPIISHSLPSFHRSRAQRGLYSTPAPLKTTATTPSLVIEPPPKALLTKDYIAPASPLDRLEFAEKASPHTPQENGVPLDASRLSISNAPDSLLFPATSERKTIFPPATPTTRHNASSLFQERRAITPVHGATAPELDESLLARFGRVDYVGKGEFSHVYKVCEYETSTTPASQGFFSTPTHQTPPSPAPHKVFAVKKLFIPFHGERDRSQKLREVSVLQALKGSDHVVQLMDSWENQNCLYIQTEYCEEGSLDNFLSNIGMKGRLDDFRIWKIMHEVTQGLESIHAAGFVHLDLKPANILINFEGTLKIGDFGLATSLPVERGPYTEGDRTYLAPEALRSEFDKPSDIFSLGLIMLEIAANVELPQYGATWSALREGDFSEVPALTQDATVVLRDATGTPVEELDRTFGLEDDNAGSKSVRRTYNFRGANRLSSDIFGLARKSELQQPPDFMQEPSHPNSLDTVVKSMLAAEPMNRATASTLLRSESFTWIASRQRAGATVFEGNWGPSDESVEPLVFDTEMTDV